MSYSDSTTEASLMACLLTPTNCYSISDLNMYVYTYSQPPPAPCVLFSSTIYAAANQYNVDPILVAAFAATETGTTSTDDGVNEYQIGGPILYPNGSCDDLCGQGPWQVDTYYHPDYTGALNVSANVSYAIQNIIVPALAAANAAFPGATNDAIMAAAGDFYNHGLRGLKDPSLTTKQSWNDGPQTYGIGLVRHYHRIADYKAVCSTGNGV